jgi:beta-glucanase (GH16 family)
MIKLFSIYSLTVLSLFTFNSCSDSTDPESDNLDEYELVWSDEFSTTFVDQTKWNYETGTGTNGDFGTGQLDRATARSENVDIQSSVADADGGCLRITTRKEAYQDRNYTSARLNTRGKAIVGPGYRVEARIWPRDVKYKGQGFAFWMMPAEKPAAVSQIMWPQGGEVDVMEYVGSIPYHNLGSVHYAWWWENNEYKDYNHGHKGAYYLYASQEVPSSNPSYGGYPPEKNDQTAGSFGFHVYAIDWYYDRMEFLVDNKVYHVHYFNDGDAFDKGADDGQDKDGIKVTDGRRVMLSEYSNHFDEWHPFEHQFYIILSAGVGGDDNRTYGSAIVPEAEFPCSVFIDWIKVYKRKG